MKKLKLLYVVFFVALFSSYLFGQDIHLNKNPEGGTSVTIKPFDENNNKNNGLTLYIESGKAYTNGAAARIGGDLKLFGGGGYGSVPYASTLGHGGNVFITGGLSYDATANRNPTGMGNVILGYNPDITYAVGNVGVGTNNPVSKLTVVGDAFVKSGGIYLGTKLNDNLSGEYIINTKQTSADVWGLSFYSASNEVMRILGSRIHIGTSGIPNNIIANYKLWVQTGIATEDLVIVNVSDWKDKVFHKDYTLKPLEEVASYIQEHQHLQGIPSSQEVIDKGYSINNLNKALLEKIEELTLYSIEQNKLIKQMQEDIQTIKQKISK